MSIAFSLVRKAVFAASLLTFAAAAVPFASAQQNNSVSGGLAGLVTDASGAAIPNAAITIVGPQVTLKLVSDAKGQYEAKGLTPGLYKITVKAPGFSTYVSTNNQVYIDHTATLNVPLAVGDTGVTVEVEGGATQIDVEDSSVNTQISDNFISDLPLPRNVSGAFYAAPGVVSGGGTGSANPSIGGSTGLENNYSADGVTITDQAYGGLGVYTPQYGSLGTGINQTFIKEVDVKTAAFEPKYGLGDGGIIEIVTKSGSNKLHGSLGAYLSPGWAYASRKQLYQYNYVVTTPAQLLSAPQYEGAATLGGYIIRDKLFFFGAFDPTLNQLVKIADPSAPLYSQGTRTRSTTSLNWSGKLTYTPFANTVIEFSSYGDPSRHNISPNSNESSSVDSSFSGTNFTNVSDSYNYGTRNSIARVNSVIYKGLTGFAAYAYSTEHFTDSPLSNTYSISDRTAQPYTPYGFGTYYKTKDTNYTLTGELQATGNLLGKHTAMVGYYYNHVDFANSTLRTGPSFAIPSTNAAGMSLATLYPTIPASAFGAPTNSTFYLYSVGPIGSGCTYCAHYKGNEVYLYQQRGTYGGSVVAATDRYKSAYGNEIYSPNKYVTINAGLRWEEQAYGGSLLQYNWKDNWSPRVGMSVDPFGTRKNKIFFAYSRYQNPLPLDAAIRQLGNEKDDTKFTFAPVTDASGNAIVDSTGAVTPNTANVLNGTQESTALGNFGRPSFSSSTGEGILPGTKMEFADEYLFGIEHEIKPGMVFKARYIDRQFARIVEDNGSQSPEGSLVDGTYAGGIANITANSDFFGNETEVTYTPAQYAAANGGRAPGQATAANYVAPVPGCTISNDTSVVNGGFFTHFDGTPYNGGCITNADTAGTLGADGKPDGFADPRRHYQGLELEFDKAFSHHWQAIVNYRYAKLYGNYEGFYRNDNGQSDPGISSLFDFTQGALGLLGDQFKRGYLNEDRRSVANALVSYTIGKETPYIGKLNGVTLGTWIHALSGTPLSAYESHPIYGNAGEVPVGGRGTLGTTPVNLYDDVSISDSMSLFDKYTLKLGFDGFNVFNSQPIITKNQNLDTAPGVINADYGKPASFVAAFHARFNIVLSF